MDKFMYRKKRAKNDTENDFIIKILDLNTHNFPLISNLHWKFAHTTNTQFIWHTRRMRVCLQVKLMRMKVRFN